MITRREKIVLAVSVCILFLLFLLSSTDLLIKERQSRIYSVSVIIEDSKDDYYSNFKKGMEQAADEFHADVSFITLYDRNSWKQQIEAARRETGDGADAVVIVPANAERLAEELKETPLSAPLVCVRGFLASEQVYADIISDSREAGRELASRAADGYEGEEPVVILSEGLEFGQGEERYQGVISLLEERGLPYRLRTMGASGQGEAFLAGLGKARQTVIALDTESLSGAAGALEAFRDETGEQRVRLYGFGYNTRILNGVDEGIVTAVSVVNDFNTGYLSIQKAVRAAENGIGRDTVRQEHFVIGREELRKPEYEKMLYPVE